MWIKRIVRSLLVVALLVGPGVGLVGCGDDDSPGEKVDKGIKDVGKGLEDAGKDLQDAAK